MIRAARKDANHAEIVKAFRDRGFSVLDISQLKNCCDLIVSYAPSCTIAVEIKDGSKPKSAQRLTEGEEKFRDEWKGCYAIVRSVEDVEFIAGGIDER